MQRIALIFCAGLIAMCASAQEYSKYSLEVGGGYTIPAGGTSNYIRPGWNAKGGFSFNFSPYVGAAINVGYDSVPVSTPAILAIGAPGGHVDVMHATLDPVLHLMPRSRVDFYLTGGGGEFRVLRQFSAARSGPTRAFIPSLGFGPPVNGAVPIPLEYSVNKPGFDVGGGLTIGAIGHGKVFTEARWEHVFVNQGHLDLLPVTFGFRW
jgi:hypothetical protein